MVDTKNSMFSDRRKKADRRQQDLPMPAGLDRRVLCRRQRYFQSQPWWLRIDYAVELVSEKNVSSPEGDATDQVLPTAPSSNKPD